VCVFVFFFKALLESAVTWLAAHVAIHFQKEEPHAQRPKPHDDAAHNEEKALIAKIKERKLRVGSGDAHHERHDNVESIVQAVHGVLLFRKANVESGRRKKEANKSIQRSRSIEIATNKGYE
jgi:hypothetical protein